MRRLRELPIALSFAAALAATAQTQHVSDAACAHACAPPFLAAFRVLEFSPHPAALHLIEQRARTGNAEARNCLAELHLLGWGVSNDDSVAWRLLHEAAHGGSARAMHRIAGMYEEGRHIARNDTRARAWQQRAATLNYPAAQSDLGRYHEDGIGGVRSLPRALGWYRKAAGQGEPFAIEALQRLGVAR